MADVIAAMGNLERVVVELDSESKALARVQDELEPLTRDYRDFIEDHTCSLFDQANKHGNRLPGDKDLREMLARRAMDALTRGQYDAKVHRREKLQDRIRDLRAEADAYRSLLSAARTEVEAAQ